MLNEYELIKEKRVEDYNSNGILLKHKKTGANVFVMSNDDENKVFYIGFRTPPYDSTGLPHILEHSVLCGSEKYPVKDPFVELCKGSLNTFLNAMTYPDKTVYPVASCNDKDFQNLMDVYLDAVFHPNIYKYSEIFRQEGFRYELEEKDADVKINGVVYNEMKGAFSSPDDTLARIIFNSLFPDTAYGVESGGDPDVIPELTYEKFLEFHSKYYHPSNCYIYLYGNMDVEEKLKYIDEEYLSKYEKIDIDSEIKVQKAFDKPVSIETAYSVTNEEPLENNTKLSMNYVIGDVLDKELHLALDIIDFALISSPGAILHERLMKSGILQDADSMVENGIRQPFYSIIANGSDRDKIAKFKEIIEDTLKNVVTEGFNKDTLLAAINVFEFKHREADFGRYPKGLMVGLGLMDSWLYDENDPYMHIETNELFGVFRERVKTDYFESLVEKYFINNNHVSSVVLYPERGLTAKKDEELAKKLKKYKESLTDAEIDELVASTKALKEYQEEPSSEEDLKKIPLLSIADIKKEAKEYKYDVDTIDGVKFVTHDVFTNGIGYLRLYFNANDITEEYIPYFSLLATFLGYVNTYEHTYEEITNQICINTGDISFSTSPMPAKDDDNKCDLYFVVKSRVMYDKLDTALSIIKEISMKSDFSDASRLKELLMMAKSRMQSSFISGGHSTAIKRASSYISKTGAISEKISGMEFYHFVDDLISEFDNRKDELIDKLNIISKALFRKDKLLVNYTAEEEFITAAKNSVRRYMDELYTEDIMLTGNGVVPIKKNEGLRTAAKIQHVALVGNFKRKGLKYTGALGVLKVILGYDYLWINVRVKGGAYGCMSGFSSTGKGYLVSYRDPNLKETFDIFKKTADYLRAFDASERDMTKYIIGAIADIDIPKTPSEEGIVCVDRYLVGRTQEEVQKKRNEILNCTVEDIRNLAAYLEAICEENAICVVGSEEKINDNKELFMDVKDLF